MYVVHSSNLKNGKFLEIIFTRKPLKIIELKRNIIQEHNEISWNLVLGVLKIYFVQKTDLPF